MKKIFFYLDDDCKITKSKNFGYFYFVYKKKER